MFIFATSSSVIRWCVIVLWFDRRFWVRNPNRRIILDLNPLNVVSFSCPTQMGWSTSTMRSAWTTLWLLRFWMTLEPVLLLCTTFATLGVRWDWMAWFWLWMLRNCCLWTSVLWMRTSILRFVSLIFDRNIWLALCGLEGSKLRHWSVSLEFIGRFACRYPFEFWKIQFWHLLFTFDGFDRFYWALFFRLYLAVFWSVIRSKLVVAVVICFCSRLKDGLIWQRLQRR